MRKHNRIIRGVKVTAYNDSNVSWVISAGSQESMTFPINKWTMKEAMDFCVTLSGEASE